MQLVYEYTWQTGGFIKTTDHWLTDPPNAYHLPTDHLPADPPTGYRELTLKRRPDSKHILYSQLSEQTNNTLMRFCILI